jgi:hypothetical protein
LDLGGYVMGNLNQGICGNPTANDKLPDEEGNNHNNECDDSNPQLLIK